MSHSIIPRLSVCIPTYNCAEFLRQAVESVLMQTYQDLEIVIIDNCSIDETVTLVEEIISTGSRNIRFYKNDRNIGMVSNLNRCLELARGTYIKFLMADDLLLQGCLEQMAAGLEKNDSVTLVACSRMVVDEKGYELSIHRYSDTNIVVPGARAITECLFGRNYIGEPTAVMFRKSDLEGKFREDMPQVLDMDMWFRLLEHGDLLYLSEPLCSIRRHARQMTHANIKSGALVEDNIKLFEAYSHKAYVNPSWRLIIQHRIYITYRVWISREYISYNFRRNVLNRYGSFLAYRLMPVGWFALNLARGAAVTLRNWFQPKSTVVRK